MNGLTLDQLHRELENIEIAYYETGAYYDTPVEAFEEKRVQELEEKYQFSLV